MWFLHLGLPYYYFLLVFSTQNKTVGQSHAKRSLFFINGSTDQHLFSALMFQVSRLLCRFERFPVYSQMCFCWISTGYSSVAGSRG